ncbi:hypothetical protein LP420_19805 [Massilia sp. B-10]|nr:hypothetical protein LP420_19805 [Massilia sp. B-10]UUZ57594.1 hypothetical protein LP419_19210 [Massilia sp. H-1]
MGAAGDDTHTDSDANTHTNPDTNAYSHPDTDSNTHTNADTDAGRMSARRPAFDSHQRAVLRRV